MFTDQQKFDKVKELVEAASRRLEEAAGYAADIRNARMRQHAIDIVECVSPDMDAEDEPVPGTPYSDADKSYG